MRNVFVLSVILSSLLAFEAEAGLRVIADNGRDLGVTDVIQCTDNLTCSKRGSKILVGPSATSSGQRQNQIAATASTLTLAQCGSTFINSGAVELELPDASTVLGCRYTFIVGNASNFVIDPATGDTILLLTNASGDSVTADAVGESLTIEAIGANSWAPVGAEKGTWSDTN